MPSTPPATTLFRPTPAVGAFSPPATSTPTSTVHSLSSSPPSSLLGCPTDSPLSHLALAERMSLLSHPARPMNLFAPQPKVNTAFLAPIPKPAQHFLGITRGKGRVLKTEKETFQGWVKAAFRVTTALTQLLRDGRQVTKSSLEQRRPKRFIQRL